MSRIVLKLFLVLLGSLWVAVPASAAPTVECRSIDYQYTECSAGSLSKPQLINQISSSACVLNRSWGYNPRSGYLWVAQGCAGIFADVAGYHYGRGDGYDSNARMYNQHGHDVGAAIGGAIVGALLESMVTGGHGDYKHETSNYSHSSSRSSGYSGCHGVGCLVGSPDGAESGAPEPGQTEFRHQGDSDPPEPGQIEMRDPQN